MGTEKNTVYGFLENIATKYGDREALFGRVGSAWYSFTYKQLKQKSETVACALHDLGIKNQDKVIIMAQPKPEYAVAFFGLALAGAVTVPMDINLSLKDQIYLADFSDAVAVVCLEESTRKIAQTIADQLPSLKFCILMIEDLMDSNRGLTILPDPLKNDDLCMIAFTSGTVSAPKGVMLTWSHFYFQVQAAINAFPDPGDRRMLSILPLHHMFEFVTGLLSPLATGAKVYYANSMMPQQILSFIQNKKINDMQIVPLFLRALKKGIEVEVQKPKTVKTWFKAAMCLAPFLPNKSLRRLLFWPLHKKLGGELRQFVCGASKMDKETADFFQNMGIDTFEGYGLTETAPIISTNHPGSTRAHSVGRPLEKISLKLAPITSEILVKGPSVMLGYYKNPQSTAQNLSPDGWFNTGDVGEIDPNGFLKIVGRNKDLIVLGNGKKVVPEEVEDFFRNLDFIQDICVVGLTAKTGFNAGTECVHAVIVFNSQKLKESSNVEQQIEKYMEILKAEAQKLSSYKRPASFIIRDTAFPKTSTLKIKRTLVKETLIKEEVLQ
ncbi:MAG: AMP-dependent synthetase/ligase [Bdellovibrio sp.]